MKRASQSEGLVSLRPTITRWRGNIKMMLASTEEQEEFVVGGE
jgi:hypothetical protein